MNLLNNRTTLYIFMFIFLCIWECGLAIPTSP